MIASAWLLAAVLAQPPGVMVDRVIAVVDTEVITESELLMEARIYLALVRNERVATREIDPLLLADMRKYVVDHTLIANQARKVGRVEVPEQQVDLALQDFERRFSSVPAYQAFLRRFGIPEDRVREILRRNLRNNVYLEQRARSRLISNGGASKSKKDDFKKRYIEDLRSRARIRLLAPSGELELQ